MKKAFDLEKYLKNGVENVVKRAARATISNKVEFAFITRFSAKAAQAAQKRKSAAENGDHIPPFLIASITSECNLHCAGCYARSNNSCNDAAPTCQLSADEWTRIFTQAKELGISFILLAGGEPLIRNDVIEAAANIPDIVFPIFTNGTMINDDYIKLFDRKRNLIPILSIEGNEENTDMRRGRGIYQNLVSVMDKMCKSKVFFGASITVTSENPEAVVSKEYISDLKKQGCRFIIYVEYVPVSEDTTCLALDDEKRMVLKQKLDDIRSIDNEMLIIAFPGDERASGGCLAAGRGFFHINSHGGAEPCPFSPYSDTNVRNVSLKEALHSKLFERLQNEKILSEEHIGGCVLFQNKETVEKLLI